MASLVAGHGRDRRWPSAGPATSTATVTTTSSSGASNADPNGITDAGQSYVVYGRPSFGASFDLVSLLAANGGDGSAGYVLNGFLARPEHRPAGIGDVNGDGFADIRVGARTDDPNGLTDTGQAYIVYGKPSPARPPSSTWSTTLRPIAPTSTPRPASPSRTTP